MQYADIFLIAFACTHFKMFKFGAVNAKSNE